MAGLTAVKLL